MAAARATRPTPEAARWKFEDLVVLGDSHRVPPTVLGMVRENPRLTKCAFRVFAELRLAGPDGLEDADLKAKSDCGDVRRILKRFAKKDPDYWGKVLRFIGQGKQDGTYRFARPGEP